MAAAHFLSSFFPFLPLPACPAVPLLPMFQNMPSSSAAPARPLPAFFCASLSPSPSIWCSQLFRKRYQLACLKSQREREEMGNGGNKALQKPLTSQVFHAGRLMASLGHLLGTGGLFRERVEMESSAQGRSDGRSIFRSTICCCSWVWTNSLHPSHQVWFKDCWRWGGPRRNGLFMHLFHKHLLDPANMPDTILGTGDMPIVPVLNQQDYFTNHC